MIVYSFNIIPNTGESERQTTRLHCYTIVHWRKIFKVPELNHALADLTGRRLPRSACN